MPPPTPPTTPVPVTADVSQLIKETFTKEIIDSLVTEQRIEGGMAPQFKRHLKDLLVRRAQDTTMDAVKYRAYVDALGGKRCRNASVAGTQFRNQLISAAKTLAATGRGIEHSD